MLTVFDKLPETTLKEVERFCVFVLAETVTVTVLPFVASVTHFSWEYGLFHFPEEAFTVTLLLPPFSAKDKVCGVTSRVVLGAGLGVGFWAGLGVGSDLADLLFLQSAMRFSMSGKTFPVTFTLLYFAWAPSQSPLLRSAVMAAFCFSIPPSVLINLTS